MPREAARREPIETRFILWFNGNGIIEKYWIPREDGRDYEMTPCLQPLARFRNDIHVLSGVDNPAARLPGPGNGHHNSMSGLVSGAMFSGRGAGGPSIDQVIAQKIGNDSRFRSLADRRLPGVVRREHSAEHELGRPRSAAAAGDDSAPAVRSAVRLEGAILDRAEEEHSGRGDGRSEVAEERARAAAISSGWRNIWRRSAAWSVRSPACRRSIRRSSSSRRKGAI